MTGPGAPVVIGVGNVLLGDDGAGPRVIGALRDRAAMEPALLPPGTRLVDGGTLGLDLAQCLDGAAAAVIVDAADRGSAPGTVAVRRGRRDLDGPVADLLAVGGMLGVLPGDVTVVEIAAGSLGPGVGLSPAVEAAIPVAAATVVDALARGGATAGSGA